MVSLSDWRESFHFISFVPVWLSQFFSGSFQAVYTKSMYSGFLMIDASDLVSYLVMQMSWFTVEQFNSVCMKAIGCLRPRISLLVSRVKDDTCTSMHGVKKTRSLCQEEPYQYFFQRSYFSFDIMLACTFIYGNAITRGAMKSH